jgi:hypothetical protein
MNSASKTLPMNFILLQKTGELVSQVVEKSKWAIFFVPIFAFIERYLFSDWEFLIYLSISMALDTALGFGYAAWHRQISVEKFGSILVKLIVYGSVLIVGHGVAHVTIKGTGIPGAEYFTMLCYASIFLKEAFSIIRNIAKLNSNLVPGWILRRLERFDENGDFNELLPKNKEGGEG